jgi:hypothetical protein
MDDTTYQTWKQNNAQREGATNLENMRGQLKAQGDEQMTVASQQEGLQEKQNSAEALLQSQAEDRRLGMFKPYLDRANEALLKFGQPGGGGLPNVNYGDITGPEDAARAAVFARAKDNAGLIGRSAVSALQNTMGARGLGSSSLATGDVAQVVNQGATQLGDVNREQSIQDLDAIRKRAAEQFQGAVTERGQDVALRGQNLQALMSLYNQFPGQITARY